MVFAFHCFATTASAHFIEEVTTAGIMVVIMVADYIEVTTLPKRDSDLETEHCLADASCSNSEFLTNWTALKNILEEGLI
jgi:hypothetical protein